MSNEIEPAKDLFFPNRFAHHHLNAIEEVMGRKGMDAFLHVAEQSQLIENFPPDNLKKEFRIELYSAINIGFLKLFGRIGGSGLAYRAGRASCQHILKHTQMLALDKVELETLSGSEQLSKLLLQLGHTLTQFADKEIVELHDRGDFFELILLICPACYGYDSETVPLRMGKKDDSPICKGIVGWLAEGLMWGTGKQYPVEEIACRAVQEVEYCIFRINKNS